MARIPDLIDRKRRGERLSRTDLETLVLGYVNGGVPDYQVAAWLMAVCWRGMEPDEVADLTEVMVDSGLRLDLSRIECTVADKHSTGGVGDKTSLVVVPLVAACGVPVAKMSGRGLGFTGGTLDKLESVPGFNVDLPVDRFVEQVQRIGLAIVGQSADLAPADGRLYALRDVTATVESIPLIASSIMSKKLAAGAQVIVLDVKMGSGAFMPTVERARELAGTMVSIGHAARRDMAAFVTDMSQPLGRAVGNALEVREAIETLQGLGPPDVTTLAITIAGEMLVRAGSATDASDGERQAAAALADGSGLAAFAALVRAQGGAVHCVEHPETLPTAAIQEPVRARLTGAVAAIEARSIAQAGLMLGAGRERKGDAIDPAAGVVLHAKVGDHVDTGAPLATVHASDRPRVEAACSLVSRAIRLSREHVEPPPLIHWRSS